MAGTDLENTTPDSYDLPIVKDFDKVCFEFGDRDAIRVHGSEPVSYFELQEYSKALAHQLYYRFGWPDYVLLDCQGAPSAEAVATLACMRLRRPFVPVSSMDQHRPGRMNVVVDLLHKGKIYETSHATSPSIVAVVVCENDRDPLLSVFQEVGIHRILYLNSSGGIQECLAVPESLPFRHIPLSSDNDDLYVLFTSGTTASSSSVAPKAVIGSHSSTHNRLRWFLDEFSSSPRVGRRTKLTFVDGVTELWGCLLDNENLLVSVPPVALETRGIPALVEDMECTQLLLLPSQASQLLLASATKERDNHNNSNHEDPYTKLERVIVSGEVCSTALWENFRKNYPQIQFINLYGQTETTGDCLYAVLDELGSDAIVDNVVAVGKPITNGVQVSLFENANPSPDCEQSDKKEVKKLIIRGTQLSNGYLGSSSQSFDSFVPGDVGFCRNGLWYVQGRIDDVVKVNGVLTSLSEVEAAFCKTYKITDASGVVAILPSENTKQISLLCTKAAAVAAFSRLNMHQSGGIPWNLIPHHVLCVPSIPRNHSSGAQKIDRKACIQLFLSTQSSERELDSETSKRTKDSTSSIRYVVAGVLNMDESDLDMSKSFVELGGDSASSITLLYRLKERLDDPFHLADMNATDILWSESLQDLEVMIETGKSAKKKLKRDSILTTSTYHTFVAKDGSFVDDRFQHLSISLTACVDSKPLVFEAGFVVTVCQGGSVVRFRGEDGILEASRHYPGWMFQADIAKVAGDNLLLVSGHSRSNRGIVICLTEDLGVEKWKTEVDGAVKSRPVIRGKEAWVLANSKLVCLDIVSGRVLHKGLEMPRVPCVSNPMVITNHSTGEDRIAFASSDWEGGIVLVNPQKKMSEIHVDCAIGPVHKDMILHSRQIIISDNYGSLHALSIDTMTISASIQLSYHPLSSPTMVDDTTIVVGSYNGKVYCVSYDEKESRLEKRWECNCRSSIYAKPLVLRMKSQENERFVLVCTTAGSILKISIASGRVEWSHRIRCEIWSAPVQIGTTHRIVFGARDSCCHVVSIDG